VFLAAAAPVVLLPWILRALPESMPILHRKGRIDALRDIVKRMKPDYVPQQDDVFVLTKEERAADAPVSQLFKEGRGFSTVMFWLSFFMSLFMVYGLSSWLTKLLASAGHSLGSALTFVMVLNFGGMIGAIGGGWLADRTNIKLVMMGMNVLAAVSIAMLGYTASTGMLYLLVGTAGACTIGTQIVGYAFAGQYYPMSIRSTGIGWASGIGRSGAVFAPIMLGVLVGMALPLQHNFIAMAIPALLAVIAIGCIDTQHSASLKALVVQTSADE
jgi:AAHS family benzoate transporter-like MFS transporter